MSNSMPIFFLSHYKTFFNLLADHLKNYQISHYFCVLHHGIFYCLLCSPLYHLLLCAKSVVKELFDKLNDVQFNYQFGGCFYTVFKSSLNGSICLTWAQDLDAPEEAFTLGQQFKRNEWMPSVAIETIQKTFEETTTFIFKDDKPWGDKSDRTAKNHCIH